MDLIEYIESLPEKQIGQLYGSASICRVVLQQLPALASQYIKRLLLIHGGVPEGKDNACITDAQGWARSTRYRCSSSMGSQGSRHPLYSRSIARGLAAELRRQLA